MNANFTYLSSNSLDDHVNFFDDTDVYWTMDDALSVSSLFGTNPSNANDTFSLLNAPRIVSIPLPVVEDFIPLHNVDAPFPYLPTPPPTPPSLTVYLLGHRTSIQPRSQQVRSSSEGGRFGKRVARHLGPSSKGLFTSVDGNKPQINDSPEPKSRRTTTTTTRPKVASELLRAVRKKRLVRRSNRLRDIESYMDNLELFDGEDIPLTNPD